MENDFREYLHTACEAAKAAGHHLQTQFGSTHQIRYKGEWDPVTSVDIEAEKIILELLGQRFPGHSFLSEESGSQDNQSSYNWIIDPLDGTRNFLHGSDHFAVSIALEYCNEIIVSVVYQPIKDEMYTAIKDQGAQLNGIKLNVSKVDTLGQSLLITGFGTSQEKRRQQLVLLGRFLKYCGGIRAKGSVALALCGVARGIYEGFWDPKLKLWDAAAGMLLVSEAGGQITSLDGTSFDRRIGDLLASNGLLHQELIHVACKEEEIS